MQRLVDKLAGFERVATGSSVGLMEAWKKDEITEVSEDTVLAKAVIITTSFPSEENDIVIETDEGMRLEGYVSDANELINKHNEHLDIVLDKYKGCRGFVRVAPEIRAWTDCNTYTECKKIRTRLLFVEVI